MMLDTCPLSFVKIILSTIGRKVLNRKQFQHTHENILEY